MDLLVCLSSFGLTHVVEAVFANLSSLDLRRAGRVSKSWHGLIAQHWRHQDLTSLAERFRTGRAVSSRSLQCVRQRAVSTVSGLSMDELDVACALGSAGVLQVWSRASLEERWQAHAHEDGIYGVDLGATEVVSCGDDAMVKVWRREDGELLQTLDAHEYVVWDVRIWLGTLVSFGYDSRVCHYERKGGKWTLSTVIGGPADFTEALATDSSGTLLTTHMDDNVIKVWDLSTAKLVSKDAAVEQFDIQDAIHELSGHEADVLCAHLAVSLQLLLSGSEDKTVRVWCLRTGVCLRVLTGHRGKVWALHADARSGRMASGGRHGELRVWDLEADDCGEGVALPGVHSDTTAVGKVLLEGPVLVSADGLGMVAITDFWR